MAESRRQLPAPPFAKATGDAPASPRIGLKTDWPVLAPVRTRVRAPVPVKATAPTLLKVRASDATVVETSIAPPAAPKVNRRSVVAVMPV